MIEFSLRKKLHTTTGHLDLHIEQRIPPGQIVTLFGKSGVGKTTILRMLAGLTAPDAGQILVDGDVWYDAKRGINRPVQERQIGFVFQDYALFPNMTVRQNLEFAAGKHHDPVFIDDLLHMTDLTQLTRRKPDTLSGGQQQRVALARALARRPKILLMDEPLSALDLEMRHKLQDEILKIHQRFDLTILLVSHDLGEIFKLSQYVLVIDQGQVIKAGPPGDVFIDRHVSGKFKFQGEILDIQPSGLVTIITISIGNHLVKVIASENEAREFAVGDQVLVSSKAFNPILIKI